MDRKEIEKYILNEFAGEELMNGDESYITLKELVDLRDVSDFFLDKILPEVLQEMIKEINMSLNQWEKGGGKFLEQYKQNAKEKYNITL